MDYIQRIPFILGLLMAIIAGIVCYERGVEQQEIYLKMAISMMAFFAIGVLIRNTIQKTIDEIKSKEAEEKEDESNKKEELNDAKPNENKNTAAKNMASPAANHVSADDFQPLNVSKAIRSELKK